MEKHKASRGGKRHGAGSKSQEDGKTAPVSFRILETERNTLKKEAAAKNMTLAFYVRCLVKQRNQ